MARQEGYVTDIDFTAAFWPVMAPSYINVVAAANGVTAPDPKTPFRYAELGCGQGFVTNVLAAAYPHAAFVGIDLNAGHIVNAREMAAEAGLSNVTFREESFRDAAELDDETLPPVDFVTLHSVISWVPPSIVESIQRFIERKLKSGGVVYVSYNSMPGWAELQPIRQLFYEYAWRATGRSDERIGAAADWAGKMRRANLAFFDVNPSAKHRMDEMLSKSPSYLVHEYLHDSWTLFYVTEVVEKMEAANVSFIGPANAVETFGDMYVSDDVMARVREAPDRPLAEMIKDYACNQWFRRDLFVRGARDLVPARQSAHLASLSFLPTTADPSGELQVSTILGDANAPTEVCREAARRIAEGHTGFEEIRRALGVDSDTCLRALTALMSAGWIHPTVADVDPAPALRLNRVIARRIRLGESYRNLACPAVGTGLPVDDVDGVAIELIEQEGELTAEDLAARLQAVFEQVGRRIVKFGGLVEMQAPSRSEMTERATAIVNQNVPLWRRLNLLSSGRAGGV